MYNGGIEYRGGFVSRLLGLDRISNRVRDLVMFRTDEIPENHKLIIEAKKSLLDAQLASVARILGLTAPFVAGMIVALSH